MAHLDDAVAQLQRDVSLERLASARGVELKGHRGVLTGTCPFHGAAPHVVTIDAKANTWSCQGCKVDGGGTAEWTMKAEGVSRRHAAQLLAADHGVGTGKVVKKSTVKKLGDVFGPEMDDDALMAAVLLYYQRTLKDSPEALAALPPELTGGRLGQGLGQVAHLHADFPANMVEQRGIEPPPPCAPSVVNGRANDADQATQDDQRRREVSASGDPVEAALAAAVEGAAAAGRWDLVMQLARELEARRLARVGNVVPLTKARR